jgi:hypothetical protein
LKLEEEIELDEDLISALFEQEEVQEELEETLLHAGSTCEEEHSNMSHEDWEEQTNKEERKTEEEAKEDQDLLIRKINTKNNNIFIQKFSF